MAGIIQSVYNFQGYVYEQKDDLYLISALTHDIIYDLWSNV